VTSSHPSTTTFPQFLADEHGLYRTRPTSFLLAFLTQAVGVAVLIAIAAYVTNHPPQISRRVGAMIEGPIAFPFTPEKPGGHGGGGTHDKFAASRGALPRMTLEDALAPPEAVLLNQRPKLPEPASVVALSAAPLPPPGQLGDPLSAVPGPLSNGPGVGGGIGNNHGGGVGPGGGPGFGPYEQGNLYRPGVGGVTPPSPLYAPDPDYSDAARKAKYQGSVILWLVVGADGRPHNLRVARSLGMGLDEKALDAVRQWRFQPATLNRQPVAVEINVEVSFRLY
jgi:periplasmic protein TonB